MRTGGTSQPRNAFDTIHEARSWIEWIRNEAQEDSQTHAATAELLTRLDAALALLEQEHRAARGVADALDHGFAIQPRSSAHEALAAAVRQVEFEDES